MHFAKSFLRVLIALTAICCSIRSADAQILRTVNVNSNTTLTTALSNALPGDNIILADGTYAGFTISKSGTAANPIIIQAANQDKAVVSSTFIKLSAVSYVTLQGVKVTTAGSTQTVDGESIRVAVWLQDSNFCRVTRCTLKLTNTSTCHSVLLGGNSNSNRIDHCEFGPNTASTGNHYIWPRGNRTIAGVTPPTDRTQWALGNGPVNPNMARNTLIDRNYFHDKADSTGEAIVLGGLGITGDYQDTLTTIEYNVFQNCDGDPEVISVKASSNTIRYNTILTCNGLISLRAGNKSTVNGNFIIQSTKGDGGIKIYEMDHQIYNNYIQDGNGYPILVGSGDPYSDNANFSHAQVFRAKIMNNTAVNPGRQVRIGHGGTLPPTDCIFVNNLMKDASGTPFIEAQTPVNMTYANNIIWPSGPGGKTTAQFRVTDPLLTNVGGLWKLASNSPAINAGEQSLSAVVTVDMDGQSRSTRDIGADEFSAAAVTIRPFSPTDVGPYSELSSRTSNLPPIRSLIFP